MRYERTSESGIPSHSSETMCAPGLRRLVSTSLMMLSVTMTAQLPQAAVSSQRGDDVMTLHESAHLVILDVSVWDWKGSPVTGLPKEAFHLLEDGHVQALRLVEEHAPIDANVARQGMAAVAAKLPANTFTNFKPFADPPANVIVLDALTSPDYSQAYHLKQVLEYLTKAVPGTPFIVFRLDTQLHLVQGLTMDAVRLRTAVAALEPTQVLPDDPAYAGERREIIGSAVDELTRYLAATPGRKTMFWYSGRLGLDVSADGTHDDPGLLSQLCAWTDRLEQNRIDVYRLGLAGGGYSAGLGCRPGRSFPTIEQAVAGEAHFYTLSYTPTNGNWDGKYRKLKVDVTTKGTPWQGVKLSYRDGYYARPDDGSVRSSVVSAAATDVSGESPALQQAMTIGAPQPDDVVFEVTATPDATVTKDAAGASAGAGNFLSAALREQGYSSYALHYAVRANQLLLIASPDQKNYAVKLEVVAVVYDSLGNAINSKRDVISTNFTGPDDPQLQTATVTAGLTTQVPVTGSSFLRIGVRDMATDKVGALEISAAAVK